jgi:predicted nucleotidyltransferase
VKVRTRNISRLIKQKVSELDPQAEVILYGSRARGDERIDSDWDILILIEDHSDIYTERKFRNKLYDLELEIGESFSVFVYSKKDWHKKQYITPFYQNVSREGLRI